MVCKAIDMCEVMQEDSNLADFCVRLKVTPRSVQWAWSWARYTQIDLPLMTLGPTMRINGL
ncbi:hypothetical protein Hanom_Chr02g00118641 [Helianthus anomalus]